jgi:hypothetical protein
MLEPIWMKDGNWLHFAALRGDLFHKQQLSQQIAKLLLPPSFCHHLFCEKSDRVEKVNREQIFFSFLPCEKKTLVKPNLIFNIAKSPKHFLHRNSNCIYFFSRFRVKIPRKISFTLKIVLLPISKHYDTPIFP